MMEGFGYQKKLEDVKAIREGKLKTNRFIRRRSRLLSWKDAILPLVILVPRDVASRAAKERCDEGFGVNKTGEAVYLDFAAAINAMERNKLM